MPWLDTHKSGFLSAFEWFWNDYASTKDNVVFIDCGSATAWMDKKNIAAELLEITFGSQTNMQEW